MRALIVVLILAAIPAPAFAVLEDAPDAPDAPGVDPAARFQESGTQCGTTTEGWTCTSWSRKGNGVAVDGTGGAYLTETHIESEGEHNGHQPNEWNSTSDARGVLLVTPIGDVEASVLVHEYRAQETGTTPTRKTTENGVSVAVEGSALPTHLPRVSFLERSVEGNYHRCAVAVGGTAVAFPCGEEILHESLLP